MAEVLTSAADLIGRHLLDSGHWRSAERTQDGQTLASLLEEARDAAAQTKRLVGEVEELLEAGGGRPGGALHWRAPAG